MHKSIITHSPAEGILVVSMFHPNPNDKDDTKTLSKSLYHNNPLSITRHYDNGMYKIMHIIYVHTHRHQNTAFWNILYNKIINRTTVF